MMSPVCLLAFAAAAAAEPFLLLHKSVSAQQGVYGESMDVLLRAFNTGESAAFGVSLKDADWPASHFEVVKGAKELTVPTLEAKANVSMRCAPARGTPFPPNPPAPSGPDS